MGSSTTAGPLGAEASPGQSASPGLQGNGARPGPLGTAQPLAGPMATVVQLMFLPTGAPAAEAVPAANQVVFIDLVAGTMTQVRSNGPQWWRISGPKGRTASTR